MSPQAHLGSTYHTVEYKLPLQGITIGLYEMVKALASCETLVNKS